MGESKILLVESLSWSLKTLFTLWIVFTLHSFPFQAQAAPSDSLIKHMSWVLKWTTGSSSKVSHSDTNVLEFENGYLVETVVEGNEIGVVPYKIRVSDDGELYAVDEVNSNIMKITPPLSQYSRGRLVAGSFQGKTGHADGKPSEARFNHPRGVTMDDKGNVYVADTLNLAIRKIGDSGVTTIAGGKSNVAGYRDGPSEDAKFSNDFDVVYVRPTCSLLVIDRGNAALRQISLSEEDCDYQYSSISLTDILLVVGAVLVGYATCLLQQGFGHSLSSKTLGSETSFEEEHPGKEKLSRPVLETTTTKEEPGWPSFGQLIIDLFKLALEFLTSHLVPTRFKTIPNLRPLKDRLKMPEDEQEPPLVQRHTAPAPISESRHTHLPKPSHSYPEHKTSKLRSSSVIKDPTLSSSKQHRSSSKRQEYAEFYASGEVVQPKIQKERSRRRHREKTTETEPKTTSATVKPVEYSNSSKFDHFNMRSSSKYGPENQFRF
ncbi:Protein SUPPRESSOR OF QUENCHING 1 [Cardamine amara subsp. amara]|uniref:Protein SUPPRESSOR OF QUENCHING 1 n=1 Tax=Cardamine amara subsp. amara TaxID=228776 RepID=A0ABD1AEK7_CARAN